MFDFFKRKKNAPQQPEATPVEQPEATPAEQPETTSAEQPETTLAEQPEAIPAEQPEEKPSEAELQSAVQAAEEIAAEQQALIPESSEPAQVQAGDRRPAEAATFFEEADDRPQQKEEKKKGFFGRIRDGLSKTRSGLTDGLADLLLGKKEIDDDLLEDLETQLIMADVGMEATREIMDRLTARISRKELSDSDALFEALIEELQTMLAVAQQPLVIDSDKSPYVILMVGINGVGKTTTIGKLAKQFQNRGKSVMLAAGDTFRAAAVEQLQVWGERNNVPVVAQHTGADSASVIFDAVEAAKSRNVDILIADTAGRLHNKDNLMQELEKVVRVMKKLDDSAPHEVMLVLDAGTGQNAINQCKQFLQSVGVTGLTLTKLDGTAKGGIIFALAKQFEIPVRFIGVGEGIDDLRPFNADEFTRALFKRDE